jgi:hypothetical protein
VSSFVPRRHLSLSLYHPASAENALKAANGAKRAATSPANGASKLKKARPGELVYRRSRKVYY